MTKTELRQLYARLRQFSGEVGSSQLGKVQDVRTMVSQELFNVGGTKCDECKDTLTIGETEKGICSPCLGKTESENYKAND